MNLLEIFQKVKANVSKKGRTYKVESILSLIFVGLMCNINSIAGISRFGKRLTKKQLSKLGFPRGRSPCQSTILETLNRVDISDFIENFYKENSSTTETTVINIDGKSLRGSKCMTQKALHILGAFCSKLSSSIGQVTLSEGENEITAMLRLLEEIDVTGKTISGDAMFTQRNIVEKLASKGADFVFTVKDNQPNLKLEIKKAFSEATSNKIETYEEDFTKAHGRIEKRSIRMIEMPWEYNNEWQHIKKIAHITRCRFQKIQGKWEQTQEEVYVITSHKSITAKELLNINREHWSIENKVHWVRDVVLREDNCTVNKRSAPQMLTALRNAVISCIKKVSNAFTATRELYAHKPHLVFNQFFASG